MLLKQVDRRLIIIIHVTHGNSLQNASMNILVASHDDSAGDGRSIRFRIVMFGDYKNLF